MLQYIHHVPGRLRIRTPAIKGNAHRAQAVRNRLSWVEGITSAETSTVTGSITVTYDPSSLNQHTILDALRGEGLDDFGPEVSFSNHVRTGATQIGEYAAKTVATVLLEKLLERSALALIGALV